MAQLLSVRGRIQNRAPRSQNPCSKPSNLINEDISKCWGLLAPRKAEKHPLGITSQTILLCLWSLPIYGVSRGWYF